MASETDGVPRRWHSPVLKRQAHMCPASYRLLAYVLFWYVASLAGIILNKHLLSPPGGARGGGSPRVEPMALALVQTVSTVLLGALSQASLGSGCLRGRRRRGCAKGASNAEQLRGPAASALLGLGFLRFSVTILGLVSLRHVAASFTETVKASSPFFTAAAALALTGERTPAEQILTLLPVVGGLMVASATELSFTLIGFGAALATNCVECVQNVVCKRLLRPRPFRDGERAPCTPAQLQYYSAAASLVVQLPLFAGALWRGALVLPSDASVLCLLAAAGLVYYAQSVLVFEVMSHCSPVTVSVLNTAKRALIICFSAAVFGNSITPLAKLGTSLTLVGACSYSLLRLRCGAGDAPGKEGVRRLGGLAPASLCLLQSTRSETPSRGAQPSHRKPQPGPCRPRRRGRAFAAKAALLAAFRPLLQLAGCLGAPPTAVLGSRPEVRTRRRSRHGAAIAAVQPPRWAAAAPRAGS